MEQRPTEGSEAIARPEQSRTGTNYRAANCQFNSGDRTLSLGERDVSFGTLRDCAIVPASWVL